MPHHQADIHSPNMGLERCGWSIELLVVGQGKETGMGYSHKCLHPPGEVEELQIPGCCEWLGSYQSPNSVLFGGGRRQVGLPLPPTLPGVHPTSLVVKVGTGIT